MELSDFAQELLLKIFTFLEHFPICQLARTCKYFHGLSDDGALWGHLYFSRWRNGTPAELPLGYRHWKNIFIDRYSIENELFIQMKEQLAKENQIHTVNDIYNPQNLTWSIWTSWIRLLHERAEDVKAELQEKYPAYFDTQVYSCDQSENQPPPKRRRTNEICDFVATQGELIDKIWKFEIIANEFFESSVQLHGQTTTEFTPQVLSFLVLHNLYSIACKEKQYQQHNDIIFDKASNKMAQLISQVQNFEGGMNAWGVLISEHALRKTGELADFFAKLACEKFSRTIQIIEGYGSSENENMKEACYGHWGYLLLEMGKKKLNEGLSMKEANKWFTEAKQKLKSITCIDDNPSYFVRPYNLACIYAICGEEEKCKKLLKECFINWSQSIAYYKVASDEDFQNVRNTKWFQRLVDKWQQVPLPKINVH